jgi:putative Mg2+ transporter-C (MgtC) family protein
MFLGALIGLEREVKNKPAGLRTHMLVAGATTLFVALGDAMVRHYDNFLSDNLLSADPMRLVEAIATGVSFLGAGTIIHRETGVEGLTTAASLLFTAAVGVAAALTQGVLAVGATLMVLGVLRGLALLEKWLASHLEGYHQGEE